MFISFLVHCIHFLSCLNIPLNQLYALCSCKHADTRTSNNVVQLYALFTARKKTNTSMRLEAIDMSIREASAFGFQAASSYGEQQRKGENKHSKDTVQIHEKSGCWIAGIDPSPRHAKLLACQPTIARLTLATGGSAGPFIGCWSVYSPYSAHLITRISLGLYT
jgi:hypothetical protein